ncbi:hypothetical protein LEJE111609_04580 [Lelliottia jeotgali]
MFYCFFVVLFSSLSFLLYSRFSCCFLVVFFRSLGFLLSWRSSGGGCCWFGCCFFVVFFSGLSFLLYSCFFVFFVVHSFCWRRFSGRSSSRSWGSGGCSISSKRSRRQTHSSGNNQS